MLKFNEEKYLTPTEAAVALGVCTASVYAWCKNGVLKSHRAPGTQRMLIRHSELERFLGSGRAADGTEGGRHGDVE